MVLIGGYLLYKPVDRLPLASAQVTEASRREPAQAPTVKPTELSDAHGRAEQYDKPRVAGADVKFDVNPPEIKEPTKPDGVAPAATTGIAPASASPRAWLRDRERRRPILSRTGHPGVSQRGLVYCACRFRSGDQPGPQFTGFLDIDRIIVSMLGDLKRAFSDVTEAKRIEAFNRNKPLRLQARPRDNSSLAHFAEQVVVYSFPRSACRRALPSCTRRGSLLSS